MKKILLLLLLFPRIIFAQAPDLGTCSSFAIFTATGAFDNFGTTAVTGNIGTNVGAFTGFPGGTVSGQIDLENAASAQAATDVAIAYSFLDGLSCDSVIGITLGNGQILTPKIYCMGATSFLNGDLILDAQGNPDAVFIFKINGAFSTSVFSRIVLIDSAFACNVYWQINGAFELNDSSVFKGTIIANGAISLLDGASLLGRGLSSNGAISLHDNLVVLAIEEGSSLPVELLNFRAQIKGVNVQLDWSTASEINNNYFTVQRSKDGISFENILQIQGAGNSNSILHYSAIDHNTYEGVLYYRLQQTDFSGKFSYSNLVAVDFTVSPGEMKLYNVSGEEVINTIPSGMYLYQVIRNNQIIQSGKIISQQ